MGGLNGAFLDRSADALEDLFFLEGLEPTVLLNDPEFLAVNFLKGSEAVVAGGALSAATDGGVFFAGSGFEDFGVTAGTSWALHRDGNRQGRLRKFCKICNPWGVAMDSGWNWTPQRGYCRWRSPMISPSAVWAMISREGGTVAGSTIREW